MLGIRDSPARRCNIRAAHTSMVAFSLNPIRLPEKLSAFGAVPPRPISGSASRTTRQRSTSALVALRPLNPYKAPDSLLGNRSLGNSFASEISFLNATYSGSCLIAFFVRPSFSLSLKIPRKRLSRSSILAYRSVHFGINSSKSPRVALFRTSTAFFQFSRTGVFGLVAPRRSANKSPNPPNSERSLDRIALYQPAWAKMFFAFWSPSFARTNTFRTSETRPSATFFALAS